MHVSSVLCDLLEIPLRAPITTAAGTWHARHVGLVRLITADGFEGIGEVATDRPGGIDGLDGRLVQRTLLGCGVDDPAELEQRLDALETGSGDSRPLRSAVESAAIDLVARRAGRSVASSLGEHARDSVRLNAFIGLTDAEQVAAIALQHVAAGFDCLKLKAGAEPVEVVARRLTAVRDAVGPDIGLRLDFNGALSPEAAQPMLEAVAPFDLEYVEQPLAVAAGVDALARLRRTSPVAIAADESIDGLESAVRLLAAEAVDVMVLKPARVGGLGRAARIARLAAAAGVATTVSTMFETGIGVAGALHLAASLPDDRAHGLATLELLAEDLLVRPLAVAAGRMSLPVGPGLGVAIDLAAVARLHAR